jgi:RNA polymerase sigma-70 factor, ECF subfamily
MLSNQKALQDKSDQELISITLKDNPDAFGVLIERYFGLVFALAYSRLNDRESAEDLAQEVFHRAFLHLGRLQNPERFSAWLTQITKNLASHWVRKSQNRSRLIPMIPFDEVPQEIRDRLAIGADESLSQAQENNILKSALDKLSDDQRDLVLLHFAEGLSYTAIGDLLDIHPTTVTRRIEKSLKKLRSMLTPILRETAPALASSARTRARAMTLVAATASLTISSKEILANAASDAILDASLATPLLSDRIKDLCLSLFSKIMIPIHWILQKFSGATLMGKAAWVTIPSISMISIGIVSYSQLNPGDEQLYYLRNSGSMVEISLKAERLKVTYDPSPTHISLIPDDCEIETFGDGFLLCMTLKLDGSMWGSKAEKMSIVQYCYPNSHGGFDGITRDDFTKKTNFAPSKSNILTKMGKDDKVDWHDLYDSTQDFSLIDVKNPNLTDIVKTINLNQTPSEEQIKTLRESDPDNVIYQLLELDTYLVDKDLDRFSIQFAVFKTKNSDSSEYFIQNAIPYYEFYLHQMEADKNGRNVFAQINELNATINRPSMVVPFDEQVKMLEEITYNHSYGEDPMPYFIYNTDRNKQYPNFLNTQTIAKLMRVTGDMSLLQGDPQKALNYHFATHRLGLIMSRDSTGQIGTMFGIAIKAISTAGLKHVFLNAEDGVDIIETYWKDLDEAYTHDREVTEHFYSPGMSRYRQSSSTSTDSLSQNHSENITRMYVCHAYVALLHSGVAARHYLLTTGDYPSNSNHTKLLPKGHDPDPFTNFQKPLRPGKNPDNTWSLYSIGPDRKDNQAQIEYDPTNGTISAGDITFPIPRKRTYPIPPRGKLGKTRDEILLQFPNGLPPDPFANLNDCSYSITDTDPAYIFSWGPDVNQPPTNGSQMPKYQKPPPHGWTVSTYQGFILGYENYLPEGIYDPTNGIISKGDVYLPRTDLGLNNLPIFPTNKVDPNKNQYPLGNYQGMIYPMGGFYGRAKSSQKDDD